MRGWVPIGFVGVMAACSSGVSVNGEIDGDKVPLKSAYFVQEDKVFEGGDGLILVVLTDLDDPCEVQESLENDLDDADDAGDLEQAWQDNLPKDFWYVSINIRVGDPSDDLSDQVVEGVGWDDVLDKDEQSYTEFIHYTDHLDEEYWIGNNIDLDDYFKFWYSDGGDLEIHNHKVDEKISGVLITEAAQPEDGDNDGDIEIRFNAERCKAMERYFFE